MNAAIAQPDFIVGVLYELPSGKIARSFGSGPSGVQYYFDDGKGGHLASHEEVKAWKHRADLNDFPNARDPRLPYTFDLHWDIKHRSELVQALADGHEDRQDMLKAVVQHQVDLGKVPASLAAEVEKAREQAAPMSEARFEAIGQAIARSHLKTLKELQSVVDNKDPAAFENMVAFKAPFLASVLVDKPELDRLVDKLETRLTLANKNTVTERAREALDFLDSAGKAPKLRT